MPHQINAALLSTVTNRLYLPFPVLKRVIMIQQEEEGEVSQLVSTSRKVIRFCEENSILGRASGC